MKKALGYLTLLILFSGLFVAGVIAEGLMATLIGWSVVISVSCIIVMAVYLMDL